ncbi:MAG: zinc ABC transporter substrate-binding protein [Flavobacteriaceae bacterium]|nr:zinc ABC transporter substrate-binding protein [Flavobacteriaceae bacterium]
MKNYIIALIVLMAFSCKKEVKVDIENRKLKVVTTTSQVTDLVKELAGDNVILEGLMGAGVDPHLYKASEGDVTKFYNADAIFYSGLHLEGKLEDVFEKMRHQGKTTIAVSDAISKSDLISSVDFASSYDPHFWFSVTQWKKVTQYVADELSKLDVKNATVYADNAKKYIEKLTVLEKRNMAQLEVLPIEKRILVTAHDAFAYFGKAYDFQVVSLQGLSTATEAGVQDVQRISSFIIEHNIKAVFIESSVPVRTVEALQAAVKSKGHQVEIGGTLYSDALGNPGTKEGTYIGMYAYNMKTIVNALK